MSGHGNVNHLLHTIMVHCEYHHVACEYRYVATTTELYGSGAPLCSSGNGDFLVNSFCVKVSERYDLVVPLVRNQEQCQ